MGYYEPYATHSLANHVLMIGPAYGGTVACAAWLAQMTGIPWVDLDQLVNHELGRLPGAPTTYPTEEHFRRLQDQTLRKTLSNALGTVIATDDSSRWPSLPSQPDSSLYRLRLAPNSTKLFDHLEKKKTLSERTYPPWLRWRGTTLESFQQWAIQSALDGPTVNFNLPINDLEPLAMAKRVLNHLIQEKICHAL